MKPLVAKPSDFFVERCEPSERIFGRQAATFSVPLEESVDGGGLAVISRTKLEALFEMLRAGLLIETRLEGRNAVLLSKNDQLEAELRDLR